MTLLKLQFPLLSSKILIQY